jgi:hypothetical protein
MPSIGDMTRTYREIAESYERRGQPQMRDRFLVLAADAALTAGQPEEAEQIRARLLKASPHHMLKPFSSLTEALKSQDVRNYVAALRRSHPQESARQLLVSLQSEAPDRSAVPPPRTQPSEQPGARAEDLKVYRAQEPEPKPRPVPAARPIPAANLSSPPNPRAAPARDAPRPSPAPDPVEVFRIREEPKPLRPTPHGIPMIDDEPERAGTAWVASILFSLVLLGSILLAAYVLGRPFLPAGWLPGP